MTRVRAVAAAWLGVSLIVATWAGAAHAAPITIVNADSAGEGFNDPMPVEPVGGNDGTTLGEQRLIAAQFAADVWQGVLQPEVEVLIRAQFNPLQCDDQGAVLGSAFANCLHANFAGAPLPNTLYPAALANQLFGADLCTAASCDCGETDDMTTQFNSSIGTEGCPFPNVWYYGLDGNGPGNRFDFVTVFLHELAHGLGFQVYVNLANGQPFFGGFVDIYMTRLLDQSLGLTWDEMSDAQRATSARDDGDLLWDGPTTTAAAASLVAGTDPESGQVRMYAPSTVMEGSSVSHFDRTLSPDELMEHQYRGPNQSPGLSVALLTDLGWLGGPNVCGDGTVGTAEDCDDANTAGGDCCAADCTFEGAGWPCADDGNVCTDDVCDGAGTCLNEPNDAACDDADACTEGDACAAGQCDSGAAVDCDDGDACTDDGCEAASGCTNDPIPGCTTTTTLPPAVCGDATGEGSVTASDALAILKAAVGGGACPPASCDVDDSSTVTATDALIVLKFAVGGEVELVCPV